MSLFRTFIAIDLSAEVRSAAVRIVRRLQKSEAKVSWTSSQNLHLTLKFLGDTPDAKISDVCRAVARAAASKAPFRVSFGQLGAFPRIERPRTVWVGVTQGTDLLRDLQSDIEDELYLAGFPRERRRYVPHLTLGRVRAGGPSQQELGRLISAHQDLEAGPSHVTEVLTIASFLDPQGPTYQVLGRAPVGG